MQKEIVTLETRFDSLQEEKDKLKEMLAEADEKNRRMEELIDESTKLLRRNTADFGMDIENLRGEVQQVRGASEKNSYDVERLNEETKLIKATMEVRLGVKPLSMDGSSKTAVEELLAPLPEDSGELLKLADSRFLSGDLFMAERAARAYVEKFPSSTGVDEAIFILGSVLYRQERHEEVIAVIRDIPQRFPKSAREGEAYLLIGKSFQALNRCRDANLFFDELLRKHPKSEPAKEARQLKQKQRCN